MRNRCIRLWGAWAFGALVACSDDGGHTPSPIDAGEHLSSERPPRTEPAESPDSGVQDTAAPDTGAASTPNADSTTEAVSEAGAGDTVAVGCSDAGLDDASCTPGDDAAQLQRALDDIVGADLAELGALGMGVSVEFPDGRRFESAAGTIGPQEDAPSYDVTTTKQVIGSVTKLFTTVLTVQLVEAGELDLEQTIDAWFDFDDANAITVRMLLQHTSGLADCLALMSEEQAAQAWSPADLVALATNAERVSEKGGVAFYSNTNFALLALIVEEVTGRSWQTNIADRITAPLGLRDVFYAGDTQGADHLVDGWVQTEEGWAGALQFTDPSVGWGYGALTATNRELARFAKALFDGELFTNPDTLSKVLDFTVEMDSSVLGDGEPPQSVGLGVLRYHLDGFVLDGHLGHILGYHAAVLHDPETGVTLTGTTNTEGAIVAITLVKIAQALRER